MSQLLAIPLLPVLLGQGIYVRRTIPRLPEPEGLRDGVSGQGQPLRLLVLGDSAAAGVGVATQAEALTGQLLAQLSERYEVQWRLLATTGHTLAQVLNDLNQLEEQTFDVVVLSVGVNDATGRTSIKTWQQQYQTLLTKLEQRFGSQLILCSSVPPMHLFTALPQPLRWFMGQQAKQLNKALQHLLVGQQKAVFMPIEFEVSPAYLAADGFHPSHLAYNLWAQQLVAHIQAYGLFAKH